MNININNVNLISGTMAIENVIKHNYSSVEGNYQGTLPAELVSLGKLAHETIVKFSIPTCLVDKQPEATGEPVCGRDFMRKLIGIVFGRQSPQCFRAIPGIFKYTDEGYAMVAGRLRVKKEKDNTLVDIDEVDSILLVSTSNMKHYAVINGLTAFSTIIDNTSYYVMVLPFSHLSEKVFKESEIAIMEKISKSIRLGKFYPQNNQDEKQQ